MDFDFSGIASAIPVKTIKPQEAPVSQPSPEPIKEGPDNRPVPEQSEEETPVEKEAEPKNETALQRLYDLMGAHDVTRQKIQAVVADKGYFPADTPVENYPPDFIDGVLVGAWDQVYDAILNMEIPF